jgi:hypothetical protein
MTLSLFLVLLLPLKSNAKGSPRLECAFYLVTRTRAMSSPFGDAQFGNAQFPLPLL